MYKEKKKPQKNPEFFANKNTLKSHESQQWQQQKKKKKGGEKK